ncbi:MAG: type I methionyl aminopeptidase [Proteobacteria bacterium]|nr:MAG: type I methionyl aminopeptidase [Pseudomonadota bacterium]PIE17843.1 MAG: type I methionyl aminopeptidase [Pseudomonadota bacterium]
MGISYKSPGELEKMWAADQVVCRVLDELEAMIQPGISTGDIDQRARDLVRAYDVIPAFLGYGHPPFPAVVCVSVNDEVVHGIPRGERVLREGDIVSVDFGVDKGGYFGDAARTFPVGTISAEAKELLEITEEALERAIARCVVGGRLRDISGAIQAFVESRGFSVVRAFYGHGIGKRMHEDPLVPNFVDDSKGWQGFTQRRLRNPKLKRGMVLAIEPMVNVGTADVSIDGDGWTARTKDGKLSAHFEHSVAITDNGPWVLSRRTGDGKSLKSQGN